MDLYVCSQDLQTLDLALLQEKRVVQSVHLQTRPEQFLACLDQQLKVWNCPLESVKRLYVVAGPGSFTSSRLSVTLVNAMAFRYQIPVVSIENPERHSLEDLLKSGALDAEASEFVVPVYDRPPHIT